ncbi:ABC transporter permease [Haloplanus halobius]|uniref:ABC transporter permease n=1 Tax=Haloplanus halobius TaxID=2934938 RepID=UPI00200FD4FF|nr:ABC transporter permease [Haloplanus sp. XH21]
MSGRLRAGCRRVWQLSGFAVRRVVGQLGGPGSRRLALTLLGVAIAIMLMTTVTGVALGLSSQTAVQADGVDYWIVPEGGDLSTIAVSTDGPRLGSTHQLTQQLQGDRRVDYATPVLLQIVSVRNLDTDRETYVLLVGVVVPTDSRPRIANLPTQPLTAGDPYYADGEYDGEWTGELVASQATATALDGDAGDRLALSQASADQRFRVSAVADADLTTGIGATPVAIVHLSELQAVTGAQEGDIADQILVSTDDRSVRSDLETLYPRTSVVARSGITAGDASTTSLPIAMGIAAFVVAFAVGVLFTATMMGLEVSRDRETLAVLSAIGYSDRSLMLLVAVETVTLCLLGGAVGVGLGVGGIYATNALLSTVAGLPAVALFRPLLLGYGLLTAALIGVVSVPYPIWLLRRVSPTGGLRA